MMHLDSKQNFPFLNLASSQNIQLAIFWGTLLASDITLLFCSLKIGSFSVVQHGKCYNNENKFPCKKYNEPTKKKHSMLVVGGRRDVQDSDICQEDNVKKKFIGDR